MLNFHHAIIKGLREKYKQARKRKTQRAIVNILPSKTFYLPSYRESTDLNLSLLGQSDTQEKEFLLQ